MKKSGKRFVEDCSEARIRGWCPLSIHYLVHPARLQPDGTSWQESLATGIMGLLCRAADTTNVDLACASLNIGG